MLEQRRSRMKLFDVHSHWGTRKGYVLRTEADLAQQRRTWNSDPKYATEQEMTDYLRNQGVRAILDFGFTKNMSIEDARPYHDYAMGVQRDHADAIFGLWLQIDPRTGADGVAEFRRCMQASQGFIGICISAPGMGHAASDPIYDGFYEASIEADRPVLVLVGFTGSGAGLPGGNGVKLDLCHPRYIDELAIRYPRAQDHRRPQSVAVARGHARGHAAQAERLDRISRLVAQVLVGFVETRYRAAPQASRHVRRRLSAVHLRASGR
jgi:hypothetical protein